MPTTDEKNILRILEEEGGELGELHEVKISRYMGLRLDYLRSILDSMGRRNLIDVFLNRRVKIADKGWRALGKNPPSPWGGLTGAKESADEPPEDKYKRWMSGKAADLSSEAKRESNLAKEEGSPEERSLPERGRKRGAKEELKTEKPSEEKVESESPSFDSYADLSPEERFKKWATK